MSPRRVVDPALFFNRELSWLAFNERVLDEAADAATPLLERAKFSAIVAANLDEFFMVRVAALLRDAADNEAAPDLAGLTPAQQLAAVGERARAQVARLYSTVQDAILPALAGHGIRLVSWADLGDDRRRGLAGYFTDAVLPVLTPLAIDVARPFPLLASLSLNLAVRLAPPEGDTRHRLAIVQVPSRLTRLVPAGEPHVFVLLEDIIRAHLPRLFPGQDILEAAVVRLARDSELQLDDEGGRTHLEQVERELRRRRLSDVVRVEVEAGASEELVGQLRDQLDVTDAEVYAVPAPLDLRVLMHLVDLPGFEALRDRSLQPVDALGGDTRDLFSVVDERDVLLHHPYESYDPVVALVSQAADDPDVMAIKQTLYRVSPGSPILASLQRAADQNKQVTVLVEVTARFDEDRNIQWARTLEAAGAHVIYGIRGYKTHAKICLVVKRTAQGLKRYVHLGTGNYNERTARVYTDFGLLTSSRALAEDASAVFSALTGYSDPPRLRKLVMAPTGLRQRFLKLIDRERRRAEAGHEAEIVAKMNSLTDEEIIRALYAASRAGVRVRLNVRGICMLRPGLPDASASVEVVSIVDRFLEHSRVYYFKNGGDDEVFLSSADWMTRNLDKRIELLFPVEDAAAKRKVIDVLFAMFRDTVKARELRADGTYVRRKPAKGDAPFRVQQALQDEARRQAALARDRAGVVFQGIRG
jgi:polyphosphate kinase